MRPIFRLPPWTVTALGTRALAEFVDWSLLTLHVPEWWRETGGDGVRVAVLDTGVAPAHPDLIGRVKSAKDFTRSPLGTADFVGHGTWCAGFIAAAHNEVGCKGIAPKCELHVGKVLSDDGSGDDRALAAGIVWAAEEVEADLISISAGGPYPSEIVYDACMRAARAKRIVVCAAGNDGYARKGNVNYPARYPTTLAVGAVDRQLRPAAFSCSGPEIDIAAPGEGMTAAVPPDQYAAMSGTSMATPFVVGVLALAIAKHRARGGGTPIGDVNDAREHLRRTARDLGPPRRGDPNGWWLIDPLTLERAEPAREVMPAPPADVLGPPALVPPVTAEPGLPRENALVLARVPAGSEVGGVVTTLAGEVVWRPRGG